jgi:hypothetical protein
VSADARPKKGRQGSQQITQGKMSYDLRRLRLHRLIERIPGTHRYQLTDLGRRTALFYSRTFNRVLRPGLSQIAHPKLSQDSSNLTPHSIISKSS